MPSFQRGLNSSSTSSFALRAGAGLAVVAVHVAVIGAIFMAPVTLPQVDDPEAVMVSLIDAPVPQVAKGEPVPEVPQPVVEPTPPEPEPVVEPEPEPEIKPEPEPEPEPEPVVEKPPMPAPKPIPKPKPKPVPKPQPKQEVKPEPKPDTPPPVTPPAGVPEGTQAQAGPQGPQTDQPVLVSSIEALGTRPMPVYPRISQNMREEGQVMVLMEIDTQGLVVRATIEKSSGFSRLDEASLVAARKTRFKPYTRNGVAYPARVKIPYVFVLRN